MKILFVCTGNTCRSPMAEGILKRLVPEWEVASRGIFVSPGTTTNPHTVRLLKERLDLDLDQMARQLTDEDCRETDLVLTMTRTQADFVRNLTACKQVYPLAEFAETAGEVVDPYGQPLAAYEAAFEQLTELIIRAAHKIRKNGSAQAAADQP